MSGYEALAQRIAALLEQKNPVIVAIDGPAASGKTTLAAKLAAQFGAQVLHMDDYFLQPHQRTPERYSEPGGNVDRERFLAEALLPLSRGEAYVSRRFDCGSMTLLEGKTVEPSGLVIVEGSYSLHPELARCYDLRVLLRIAPDVQSARILTRNGKEKHAQFMARWIPLENRYFEATGIEARCDLQLAMEEEA